MTINFSRFYIYSLSFILFFCTYCKSFPLKEGGEDEKLEKLIETKVLLAQNKLERGRAQLALPELRELNRKYPKSPMVLNMLGLVHLALKNYSKALESLQAACRLESGKVAFGLNLSSVYLSLNEASKARELLLKLSQNETYAYKERILHNIALSYEQEKNWKEAEAYYQEALIENPVYYLSMVNLAKVYHRQSFIKKAFKTYKKASQYCPICYEAKEKLALFYVKKKQISKALNLLNYYLSIKEVTPEDKNKARKLKRYIEKKSRDKKNTD